MATFRNSQIEAILNDERLHNRTIMDRQKQHVSSIGDQRAPSTMRDVKNEAILGTKIDQLKETINKVIQLISPFQYGKIDDKKVERMMRMPTNDQSGINKEIGEKEIKESMESKNLKKITIDERTPGDSTGVVVGVNSQLEPSTPNLLGERGSVAGQSPPQ